VSWIPIPEPVTWVLKKPLVHNGMTYPTVTLRAPTGGEILKATAVRNRANMEVGLRLIECVNVEGVPYEALCQLPAYLALQMGAYMDEFEGTPAPDPLEAWRKARSEAAEAEAATPATSPQPTDQPES